MLLKHCSLLLLLAAGLVLGGRGGFRSGGGSRSWGSRSSSSGRGGWFSRSRSSSASKPASSSYPKQQWGSSSSAGGLSRTGSSSSLGSTGTRNIGGGQGKISRHNRIKNIVGTRNTGIGGGGFVNPAGRTPTYATNPYGTKQYSGWSTPRGAVGGVHSFGGKNYGYRTPVKIFNCCKNICLNMENSSCRVMVLAGAPTLQEEQGSTARGTPKRYVTISKRQEIHGLYPGAGYGRGSRVPGRGGAGHHGHHGDLRRVPQIPHVPADDVHVSGEDCKVVPGYSVDMS